MAWLRSEWITAAERAAMQAVLLGRIVSAGPYVAGLMLVLAATKPWTEPQVTAERVALLVGGDALAAAAVLVGRWLAASGRVPPRAVDALVGSLVVALLFDVALHAVVLGKSPEAEAISYVLVIMGSAVFFVDARWFAAALLAATGAWVVTAWIVAGPGSHVLVGVHMATASVASAILFVLQRRTLGRAERLRIVADERATKAEALAREVGSRYRDLEAFAYTASHDLRAPLRAVRTYAEMLEESLPPDAPAKQQETLAKIRKEAERLAILVEDLLTLSRIGTSALQPERVDLTALAQDVVAATRTAHPEHAPRVEVAPGLEATCDASLVRVVLENLVGNAWKFTRDRRDARIEVGREGDAFFVRDNGIGFPAELAAELFQPFRRLSGAAGFEGTGVGLASVHRIVTKHGGRVWAQGHPGQGATMWFTLPPPPGSPPRTD